MTELEAVAYPRQAWSIGVIVRLGVSKQLLCAGEILKLKVRISSFFAKLRLDDPVDDRGGALLETDQLFKIVDHDGRCGVPLTDDGNDRHLDGWLLEAARLDALGGDEVEGSTRIFVHVVRRPVVVNRILGVLEEISHFLGRSLSYRDVAPLVGPVRIIKGWKSGCFDYCQIVVVEDSKLDVVSCVSQGTHD